MGFLEKIGAKMSKNDKLNNELKITDDKDQKIIDLQDQLKKSNKKLKDAEKYLNKKHISAGKTDDYQTMVLNAKKIVEKANAIDDEIRGLPANKVNDRLKAEFKDLGFDDVPQEMFDAVASDLPPSKVLSTIPIRVVEQMLAKATVNYPLSDKQNIQFWTNGLKQFFYRDYRDMDDRSGYGDVEIGDFNQGNGKGYQETINTTILKGQGYDMLNEVLRDFDVMSVGVWIALITDYNFNVVRPYAKYFYQQAIKFFTTAENFDGTTTFVGTDSKDKAKELWQKLVNLQTPSRTHLTTKLADGTDMKLEYQLKAENTQLIFNKKYASNYRFDLTSGLFQLGEIKLPANQVEIVDFDTVTEYDATATDLASTEVLLIDKGVYVQGFHFNASTVVVTTRLKSVFNQYIKHSPYKMKNKILWRFKNSTTNP